MKTWLKMTLFSLLAVGTTACVAPKTQTEVSSTSLTEKVVEKKEEKISFQSQSVKAFTKNVKVKNVYTDNELILLFKKHGYYNTELIGNGLIRVVIYDGKFIFYNGTKEYETITLAIYFAENDINLTLNHLNKWNNDYIMKATLDNNTLRYSHSLDTSAGISEEQILELLKMGEYFMRDLTNFLEAQRKKK